MSPRKEIYRHLSSMRPMMPSALGELSERCASIFKKAGELTATLPSRSARRELALLVRSMNSYYSNLIEGHKTLPKDIEKALRSGASGTADEQHNQRLSIAHVRAEESMRAKLAEDPDADVFSKDFICWLHREFYSHLPVDERLVELERGTFHPEPLVPGELRTYNVSVGRHDPPDHPVLGAFLDDYASVYGAAEILAMQRPIALAAAHHRLAWIHPFADGNGRVARLQSQAAMIRAGIDGEGLWTLSRGLARQQADYYKHLQNADGVRLNDFDGRGPLSDRMLGEFCGFFLTTILDQMEFMIGLVRPDLLARRIEQFAAVELTGLGTRMQERIAGLLKALCVENEMPRGKVAGLFGLSAASGRELIRAAVARHLVTSDTEKSPLRIAFPAAVAEFYFPRLG